MDCGILQPTASFKRIALKKSALGSAERVGPGWLNGACPSDGHRLRPDREQLAQVSKVLGGGGEEELIVGAVGTSEAEAIQLQNAFEMREQHLHPLPLALR